MPENPEQPKNNPQQKSQNLSDLLKDVREQKTQETTPEEDVKGIIRAYARQELITEGTPLQKGFPKDVESRNRLATEALRQFKDLPQPHSWEEHLNAHRIIAIIHDLDEGVFSQIVSQMQERVSTAITCYEAQWKAENPIPTIDAYEGRVKQLYRLVNLQVSPKGMDLCRKAMEDSEKEMNATFGKKLPGYINQKVHESRKFSEEFQSEIRKRLAATIAVSDTEKSAFGRKLTSVDGEPMYEYKNEKGEKSLWRLDPMGDSSCCLRSVKDGNVMIAVTLKDLFNAFEKDQVDLLIERGLKNFEGENKPENQRQLSSFDLPSEGPIVHLRVFPKTYDKTIATELHGATLLSSALQSRYTDKEGKSRVVATPVLFTDDPKTALIDEIKSQYRNGSGAKQYCIDIFNHGTKDRIAFEKSLRSSDITDIVQKFPDCKFTIGTMACFGGGMREGFLQEFAKLENKDTQKRMAIFLQTKPDVPGVGAMFPSESGPRISSTNYTLHFMQAMYEGKTYGEAARIADTETKKYMPLDAEAIIDGQLISRAPFMLAAEEAAS